MNIRYSRDTGNYIDAVSVAYESTLLGAPDHAIQVRPVTVDGSQRLQVTDLTTGRSEIDAGVNPERDSLLLGFSDATAGLYLRGGYANDLIFGGDAVDVLIGGGGNDTIDGGAGDDRIIVQGYYSTIDGGAGFDTLQVASNTLVQFENGAISGIERVLVDDGASGLFQKVTQSVGSITSRSLAGGGATISGTDVADRIIGGAGQDSLYGNGGDDTIVISTMPAHLFGGDGDDRVQVRGGGAFVFNDDTTNGVERIIAFDGSDVDVGQVNAPIVLLQAIGTLGSSIVGSRFDDRIIGSAGDDVIQGGYGADVMTGGAGADTFVFRHHWDVASGTKRDTITDFSHADGDLISLAGGTQYVGPWSFIDGNAFTKQGGAELRIVARPNDVFIVQGDVNADGRADFAFVVKSIDGPLTADDFIL